MQQFYDAIAGNRRRLRSLLVLSIATTFPLAACDKAKDMIAEKVAEKVTEKAIEKEMGGGEVDIDQGNKGVSFTGKDKDGKEFSLKTGAQLPDDWPKEVPVYPGAKIENSMAMSKTAWALTLSTSDPQSKVIDFYKAKLSGLDETGSVDTGKQKMLVLKNKEGDAKLQVSIMAVRESDDEDTKIQLGIQKEAPK